MIWTRIVRVPQMTGKIDKKSHSKVLIPLFAKGIILQREYILLLLSGEKGTAMTFISAKEVDCTLILNASLSKRPGEEDCSGI